MEDGWVCAPLGQTAIEEIAWIGQQLMHLRSAPRPHGRGLSVAPGLRPFNHDTFHPKGGIAASSLEWQNGRLPAMRAGPARIG
jgi:hypothetical protein